MKQLSLYEKHKELGAIFNPYGDWELPLHYGKPETEALQVRKILLRI